MPPEAERIGSAPQHEARGPSDMDAATATGSGTPAVHDVITTDVLIVGFGLSAIPLIIELEQDRGDYAVVSDGESIWDRLEKNGRLGRRILNCSATACEAEVQRSRSSVDAPVVNRTVDLSPP